MLLVSYIVPNAETWQSEWSYIKGTWGRPHYPSKSNLLTTARPRSLDSARFRALEGLTTFIFVHCPSNPSVRAGRTTSSIHLFGCVVDDSLEACQPLVLCANSSSVLFSSLSRVFFFLSKLSYLESNTSHLLSQGLANCQAFGIISALYVQSAFQTLIDLLDSYSA